MKAAYTLFLFLLISGQVFARQGYDTLKIYFAINIIALDNISKEKLDSVANIIQKSNLLIYGYADYLGNEPSNLDLAIGRANNVKQYLLHKKIPGAQILVCEGIGQVNRKVGTSKDGVPEDRRVDIFIKNNTLPKTEPIVAVKPGKKMRVTEITQGGKLVPVKVVLEKEKEKTTDTVETINVAKKIAAKKTPVTKAITPKASTNFEQLAELNPNEILRVETIHFISTKHFITEESKPVLLELLKTMQDFPDLAIRIEGHVCCVRGIGDALDTDTYELKLSENRARHIYLYLMQNGIDTRRLEYAGFGKSRPIIAVEKTEEDAQKNRRVEIRVLRN